MLSILYIHMNIRKAMSLTKTAHFSIQNVLYIPSRNLKAGTTPTDKTHRKKALFGTPNRTFRVKILKRVWFNQMRQFQSVVDSTLEQASKGCQPISRKLILLRCTGLSYR
ncbi:hypothetical protein B5F94_09590 [Flavonifractor sp. An4]|nr:hypothetical protein B5F94_09590 [Flavonifractor sp. An4]